MVKTFYEEGGIFYSHLCLLGIVFDTQEDLLPLVWPPLVARYRFRYPTGDSFP